MLILPLKFIREEDKKVIGLNLFNLAKLGHLGLPVVESVIAIPPPEIFENAVNRYLKNHPNIKDHALHIKTEILKIPIPESIKTLELANNHLAKNSVLNIEKLWENLLEKWALELVSKIERNEKDRYHLTPQLIIFSANFTIFGKGYFNEDRDHAIIKVEQGKLDFHTSSAIENLIIVGNKKLLIPQIYYWGIEDNKIKIVKVQPFTQSLDEDKDQTIEKAVSTSSPVKVIKTATKILLDYHNDVLTSYNSDGIILNLKKLDAEEINAQLAKIHTFDTSAKIIFNTHINLTHSEILEFAKIFLFFKNKRKLDAQIILPETFSQDEFLSLKRDFASLGIYSKGSLKLWKQFNYPADFLNFNDYFEAGFDGVVIDIDKLAKSITGLDSEIILKDLKVDWLTTIEKFLKDFGLPKIIKSGKQVLIKGDLCQNEELLNYLIRSGVWGVAFKNNIAAKFKEHISYLEKQTIKKLSQREVQH